ncbi:YggS family pyridoxal phosphate-dependent enzyme [Parathalassolituus penaei]|uniref:Pyridoxal phosphate homeostasis protein n=1 Tax=Parathalassolituus penaei TaxID=2997323 RepID=A0A9X3ITB3_9GAMM|nr:YggS family pyridoxal phosphate-dependent enzyme [Parathalassolituus penaei]MCY0965018.1 YggS family pyridoxal phosphate-dependent enzyme [Parathalassolituus penaei]
MSTIEENYIRIDQRISNACHNSGVERAHVRLLAVSKTKPASMVRECYNLGQRSFGENYLQDALGKMPELADLTDIEWHFIGPLQSNKTRSVAEHFHWMETLERDRIATRLNDQRPASMPALNVLIQVNISEEEQKSGVMPADVAALAQLVNNLPRLCLRGLMCIPEDTDNQERLRDQFRRMQLLLEEMQQRQPLDYPNARLDTLSMGMSGDLELAIAEGSTQVRIGTDIFGARDYHP